MRGGEHDYRGLFDVVDGVAVRPRHQPIALTADGVDINRAIIEQGLALANKIARMARASSA